MNPPEHPGQPKWQEFKGWSTMKTPTSIQIVKSAEETRQEQLEKFGLQDEDGSGWGDASDPADSGWGDSSGVGGGWN